jgi:hypothetical protein
MHPPVFCMSCGKPNAPDARCCYGYNQLLVQAPQMQAYQQPMPVKKSSGLTTFIILGVFGLLLFWFITWSYRNDFGAIRQTINSFMGWKDTPAQLTPPPSKASTPEKPPSNLNLWKYEAIKTGMKQEEVEKILGSKGTQIFDSSDRTGSMTSYTWKEGEAATACMIQITFINKKVHDKSQFGLE